MATTTTAPPKCSKCNGVLDTTETKSKDNWCRKCRADYQRDYQDRQYREAKAEGYSEGFAIGYAECRMYLMQHFNPHPLGQFRGIDILNYLRELKPSGSGNKNV